MWQQLKKIFDVIYLLVVVVLISIAALVVLTGTLIKIPQGYRLLSVQTGSMEPAIKTGSLILTKPSQSYQEGDVITFHAVSDEQQLTTHRVAKVFTEDNAQVFETKGDANDISDSSRVGISRVVGKMQFSIPYLGYVVTFAKTQNGFVMLVIIPTTIIVYSELMSMKNEARRLLQERKKKAAKPAKQENDQDDRKEENE